MSPQETTQLEVQFTAPASPWWLLLLVPLAVLIGWWLYRIDLPGLARRHRVTLVTLRCALLVLLALLAFRPNLIHRRTLTYPGRVLLLADDTRSMTASDTGLSDGAALRVARSLPGGDGAEENGSAGENATLHGLASTLHRVVGRLRVFERYSREADRSRDAYWDRAERARGDLGELFERLEKRSGAVAQRVKEDLPDAAESLGAVREKVGQLRDDLSPLFTGDRWPGHAAFASRYERADKLAGRLLDLQARWDAARVEGGDQQLAARAKEMRQTSRLRLLRGQMRGVEQTLQRIAPSQRLQPVRLSSGEPWPREADQIAPADGPTDIVGALQRHVQKENEFPITAMVVAGDGRDVVGTPPAALRKTLTRRDIPVYGAVSGAAEEPKDVAVVEMMAPPIAVSGAQVTLRARIKAALEEPAEAALTLKRGGNAVAERTVELTPTGPQTVEVPFTPEETGRFRYTLQVAGVPGEVFPNANNRADFALNVRPEKLDVLLLDWRPRWETRYALNTLRRLPYVRLNPLVVVTLPGGELKRGAERGAWPESPAALRMYDLIVLGDVPPDLLTDAEWNAMRDWVQQRGNTLCFLAPDGRFAPSGTEAEAALMPRPLRDAESGAGALERMHAAPAGRAHPVTRRIAGPLADAAAIEPDALKPGGAALLTGPGSGEPLISWRPAGEGKTLLIDHPDLWRLLNPTRVHAHQRMFVELLTWSVEGGWPNSSNPDKETDGAGASAEPKEEEEAPRLALDAGRAVRGRPVQVWAANVEGGATIEAVAGGDVTATADLSAPREGAALRRAVFETLPVGEVRFRLQAAPEVETGPVIVVERDRELDYLANESALLGDLAEATGGEVRPATQIDRLLAGIDPKQRVERQQTVWRLWDAWYLLGLLVGVLTVEWIWRKLAGLV